MKNNTVKNSLWICLAAYVITIIVFTMLSTWPADVWGATEIATVSWKYSEKEQKKIKRFIIYDQDNKVIVKDISPDKRKASFEYDDSKDASWYITAATELKNKRIIESKNSNIISYHVKDPEVVSPNTFLITVTPLPDPKK